MIYDTYSVSGNCRDCGVESYHHIDGYFCLCEECAYSLLVEIISSMPDERWKSVRDYIFIFKDASVNENEEKKGVIG